MTLPELCLDLPELSWSIRAHSAASFLFYPKVSAEREGDIVTLGPEGNPGWVGFQLRKPFWIETHFPFRNIVVANISSRSPDSRPA